MDRCQPQCPLRALVGGPLTGLPDGVKPAGVVVCSGVGSVKVGLPGLDPLRMIALCVRVGQANEAEFYLLPPLEAVGLMTRLGEALAEFVASGQDLANLLADEPVETR